MKRRRVAIIDGEIQWWVFRLVVAGMFSVVIASFGLAFYLLKVIRTLLAHVEMTQVETLLGESVEAVAIVMSAHLVMTSLAGCYAIYSSARIAGPIYRIRRELKQMAETGDYVPVRIRPGDKLRSLVQQINSTIEKIQSDGALRKEA